MTTSHVHPRYQEKESSAATSTVTDQLVKDVYYGNGRPGLIARMGTVEDRVDALDDERKLTNRKLDRIQLGIIALLGSVASDLIIRGVIK